MMAMDKFKRKMAENWIDQAQRQWSASRDHLQHGRYPETVQAAQQCCELCLKAIFSFIDIGYPREHGLDRQEMCRIANELRERNISDRLLKHADLCVGLGRLLFLVNFWAEFYLIAKYGIQDGYLASADELLTDKEAALAAEHAFECWAILARSLGIPAVTGLRGILQGVRTGDVVVLDG
jgi:hypothetical protein